MGTSVATVAQSQRRHLPARHTTAGARPLPVCRRASTAPSRRRPVIRSASEVPAPLIDAFIGEMAVRLSRTSEARACAGLSFAFVSYDVDVMPARYEVRRDGVVSVRRGASLPATFTFISSADTFDSILRGKRSALLALLQRHVHLDGSLTRLRQILRMMPAVQEAYEATREHMIEEHGCRYDFAF
jgi:hypothetical protein